MRILIPTMILAAATLAAAPVMAAGDLTPTTPDGLRAGAPKPPSNTRQIAPPPPDAVPGAKARANSVAPAAPGAADLPPNEALFDAINRGDIVSARDAITRGADLDATNMLGLSPLELSVDLGRNDISFLLLSLRGTSAGERPAGEPEQSAQEAPLTPAQKRQAAAAARAEARAEARAQQAQAHAQAGAARPAAPQAPQLFAGNGGAAVPSAGFLGFDPHR